MKYNQELFFKFYPDALELFKEHVKEIDLFKDDLNVDKDLYEIAEQNGSLKIYTIRELGDLVGYCSFFVYRHAHHSDVVHAKQDVLFIRKDKRGIGMKFLRYCEEELAKAGVNIIQQCVPIQKDWSPVLKKMGYKKIETVYARRL